MALITFKRIKTFLLFFVFSFSLLHLKGQEVIISGADYNFFGIPAWGYLHLDDCSAEIGNFPYSTTDFSFVSLSSEYLYAYSTLSAIIDTTLYLHDIENGTTNVVSPFLQPRIFTDDHFIKAVACDYAGHLYAAGKGLSYYDATEDIINAPTGLLDVDYSTYLGDLPVEMEAAGAMAYREGRLFLTTISNTLVEIDVENPMVSTVVTTFPSGTPPIDAMVTFPYRCDSIITYAIAREDSSSIIYILDFDDYSLTEICQTSMPIFGAAAAEECIIPPCELFVDLDMNDSGGLTGLDFSQDTICSAFYGLGDIDIEVFSVIDRLDSLLIAVVFPPDGGNEQLWLEGNAAITVLGSGTSSLVLINNGSAIESDFEVLLHAIFYQNAAAMPTIGTREIIIIPHAWQYVGVPSKTYFVLDPSVLSANEITVEPLCFGDANGSIDLVPQGSLPPYSVEWEDGQSDFMVSGISSGEITYILSDSVGCMMEHTTFLSEPDSLITTIEALDTICSGTATLLEANPLGGTSPYQYLWNDGSDESQFSVNGAGPHFLTLTDENGCTDTASIQLTVIDTIFVNQENVVCEGEVFEWQDMFFTSDTLVCLGFTSLLGCDSIHCMDIQFLDSVLVNENIILCEGDFFETGNQTYFSDTTFCQALTAANGCDSTYCLDLQFRERDVFLFETICEGGNYTFGGESLTTAGIYVDSLIASNGCDSLVVLDLSFWPSTEILFEVNGSFCIDEEVMVSVEGFTDYQWSTGAESEQVVFDTPGWYGLTVIDENDCFVTDSILLDDTALEIFYSSAPPLCYDSEEGFIQIDSVRNARLPIEYLLDGVTQAEKVYFESLGLGVYEIEVIDADGCRTTINVELFGPQELQLALPDNQMITLGDTISLPVDINFQPFDIQWNPPLFMACDTCLQTNFWPIVSTYYELNVKNAEDCEINEGIWFLVKKDAPVFMPNAFSPNDDGINDYFTIFTHPSISMLKSVQIFNRWGGLVYKQTNIQPNIESYGWDGKTNGRLNTAGVYICTVEVVYLDGRNDIITGELVLMR